MRLVRGQSSTRKIARAALPSFAAQPFRPGELVMPVRIDLGDGAMAQAIREASASRVPVELWVRIAIEGSRQLDLVIAATGVSRGAFAAHLDGLADGARTAPGSLHTPGLSMYARRLRSGEPTGVREAGRSPLTVLIPDTLALAWTRAANRGADSLAGWAEARLRSAPEGVVGWEAAAAASGDSLGEWMLAAALVAG